MEELNKILELDQAELLSSIDEYQRDIIEIFLSETNNDYLASADKWLNATTANTAKFGGSQNKSAIYREKLLDEIEKFLCGNKQYDEDRNKIVESAVKTKEYIIGVMSAAIGNIIGAAGVFIAPVIVLLLMSVGKVGVKAWCEMRVDIKGSAE